MRRKPSRVNRIESRFGWSLPDLAVHRCTRGAHKPGLGLRSSSRNMGHHAADTRPFCIRDLFFSLHMILQSRHVSSTLRQRAINTRGTIKKIESYFSFGTFNGEKVVNI